MVSYIYPIHVVHQSGHANSYSSFLLLHLSLPSKLFLLRFSQYATPTPPFLNRSVMHLLSLTTHPNVTHLPLESFLFSTCLDFLVFCLMYLGCWYDTSYYVPYSGLFVIFFNCSVALRG